MESWKILQTAGKEGEKERERERANCSFISADTNYTNTQLIKQIGSYVVLIKMLQHCQNNSIKVIKLSLSLN